MSQTSMRNLQASSAETWKKGQIKYDCRGLLTRLSECRRRRRRCRVDDVVGGRKGFGGA
jgi:hypothetical protein